MSENGASENGVRDISGSLDEMVSVAFAADRIAWLPKGRLCRPFVFPSVGVTGHESSGSSGAIAMIRVAVTCDPA